MIRRETANIMQDTNDQDAIVPPSPVNEYLDEIDYDSHNDSQNSFALTFDVHTLDHNSFVPTNEGTTKNKNCDLNTLHSGSPGRDPSLNEKSSNKGTPLGSEVNAGSFMPETLMSMAASVQVTADVAATSEFKTIPGTNQNTLHGSYSNSSPTNTPSGHRDSNGASQDWDTGVFDYKHRSLTSGQAALPSPDMDTIQRVRATFTEGQISHSAESRSQSHSHSHSLSGVKALSFSSINDLDEIPSSLQTGRKIHRIHTSSDGPNQTTESSHSSLKETFLPGQVLNEQPSNDTLGLESGETQQEAESDDDQTRIMSIANDLKTQDDYEHAPLDSGRHKESKLSFGDQLRRLRLSVHTPSPGLGIEVVAKQVEHVVSSLAKDPSPNSVLSLGSNNTKATPKARQLSDSLAMESEVEKPSHAEKEIQLKLIQTGSTSNSIKVSSPQSKASDVRTPSLEQKLKPQTKRLQERPIDEDDLEENDVNLVDSVNERGVRTRRLFAEARPMPVVEKIDKAKKLKSLSLAGPAQTQQTNITSPSATQVTTAPPHTSSSSKRVQSFENEVDRLSGLTRCKASTLSKDKLSMNSDSEIDEAPADRIGAKTTSPAKDMKKSNLSSHNSMDGESSHLGINYELPAPTTGPKDKFHEDGHTNVSSQASLKRRRSQRIVNANQDDNSHHQMITEDGANTRSTDNVLINPVKENKQAESSVKRLSSVAEALLMLQNSRINVPRIDPEQRSSVLAHALGVIESGHRSLHSNSKYNAKSIETPRSHRVRNMDSVGDWLGDEAEEPVLGTFTGEEEQISPEKAVSENEPSNISKVKLKNLTSEITAKVKSKEVASNDLSVTRRTSTRRTDEVPSNPMSKSAHHDEEKCTIEKGVQSKSVSPSTRNDAAFDYKPSLQVPPQSPVGVVKLRNIGSRNKSPQDPREMNGGENSRVTVTPQISKRRSRMSPQQSPNTLEASPRTFASPIYSAPRAKREGLAHSKPLRPFGMRSSPRLARLPAQESSDAATSDTGAGMSPMPSPHRSIKIMGEVDVKVEHLPDSSEISPRFMGPRWRTELSRVRVLVTGAEGRRAAAALSAEVESILQKWGAQLLNGVPLPEPFELTQTRECQKVAESMRKPVSKIAEADESLYLRMLDKSSLDLETIPDALCPGFIDLCIAQRSARTLKYAYALSRGTLPVTIEYLRDCDRAGKIINPTGYTLPLVSPKLASPLSPLSAMSGEDDRTVKGVVFSEEDLSNREGGLIPLPLSQRALSMSDLEVFVVGPMPQRLEWISVIHQLGGKVVNKDATQALYVTSDAQFRASTLAHCTLVSKSSIGTAQFLESLSKQSQSSLSGALPSLLESKDAQLFKGKYEQSPDEDNAISANGAPSIPADLPSKVQQLNVYSVAAESAMRAASAASFLATRLGAHGDLPAGDGSSNNDVPENRSELMNFLSKFHVSRSLAEVREKVVSLFGCNHDIAHTVLFDDPVLQFVSSSEGSDLPSKLNASTVSHQRSSSRLRKPKSVSLDFGDTVDIQTSKSFSKQNAVILVLRTPEPISLSEIAVFGAANMRNVPLVTEEWVVECCLTHQIIDHSTLSVFQWPPSPLLSSTAANESRLGFSSFLMPSGISDQQPQTSAASLENISTTRTISKSDGEKGNSRSTSGATRSTSKGKAHVTPKAKRGSPAVESDQLLGKRRGRPSRTATKVVSSQQVRSVTPSSARASHNRRKTVNHSNESSDTSLSNDESSDPSSESSDSDSAENLGIRTKRASSKSMSLVRNLTNLSIPQSLPSVVAPNVKRIRENAKRAVQAKASKAKIKYEEESVSESSSDESDRHSRYSRRKRVRR